MDRTYHARHDDFETIAPAEVPLTRDEAPPAADDGQARRRLFTWGAAVVALLLAAAVLLFLPDALRPDTDRIATAPDRPAERTRDPSTAPAEAQEDAGEPVAPYQQSRFERERRAVEDLISRMLDRQDDLEAIAVARWGAEAFGAARALANRGDGAFVEERFEAAREHYSEALAAFEALLERADEVYETAVARGFEKIEAGDSTAALEAFDLALAIRSDSDEARRGRERAEVLDDVLARVAEADRLHRDGELDDARQRLQQALSLDGSSRPARELLAQVDRDILERDYNAALSRGYAALADGRLDASRSAFRDARRLRPNSVDAEEGLLLVEQAALDARIEGLRQDAEAAIDDEDWEAAERHYSAVLELDGTLSFARQGRRLARARKDLSERIVEALENPDRLSEDPVLAEARDLLAEARAIEDPRPRLAGRIDALEELLEVASEPVTVRLRSDGATEVTILRVARLGKFEERRIELRPGVYTATGSRPGYRDVRLEFRVAAEAADNPVVIRTEERI